MLPPTELLIYLDAAKEAARRGAGVLEEWRTRFQVREKARFDLVTDADLGSQKAIYAHLHERFPDHVFLGEAVMRSLTLLGQEVLPALHAVALHPYA